MKQRPIRERGALARNILRIGQLMLMAGGLFLWLVLTPTGRLLDWIVWWKPLSASEMYAGFALLSLGAASVHGWLDRRFAKTHDPGSSILPDKK